MRYLLMFSGMVIPFSCNVTGEHEHNRVWYCVHCGEQYAKRIAIGVEHWWHQAGVCSSCRKAHNIYSWQEFAHATFEPMALQRIPALKCAEFLFNTENIEHERNSNCT